MPVLFGEHLTRTDLSRRVGHPLQLAGVRMMELRDGQEAGVRIADVRTGSGLRFQITIDRGMDISVAEYKGIPLAWRSPAGDVNPSFYDAKGLGWARSFAGGLMTGCGLTHLGAPCVDDGEELGLHGRLSNTPAGEVRSETVWRGDRCAFVVRGAVREAVLFRHNLVLDRTIESVLGESSITVTDVVTNEGSRTSPLMILYHVNLGWPLLDEGAQLLMNAGAMSPRDAEAEKGMQTARVFSSPSTDYREQVFFYDLHVDEEGYAAVLLANRKLHLGLYVRFRKRELHRFIQWKMMGEGTYVLGLEPANCLVQGRAKERERGTLQFIEPGERREFIVHLGVLEGEEAIDQFSRDNRLR